MRPGNEYTNGQIVRHYVALMSYNLFTR